MTAYKIYFGNRELILSGKVTKSFEKNDGLFYKFSDKDELRELVIAFHDFTKVPRLYILHKDTSFILDQVKTFHTIVEAAGGVVRRPDGKFLGILRNGVWDLPKGKVEKGEYYKQTALREVKEECGLQHLEIGRHLIDTYHTYKLKDKLVLKRTLWYAMNLKNDEVPVLQSEEGITDYQWFDADTISTILKNTYESLKDVYKTIVYS